MKDTKEDAKLAALAEKLGTSKELLKQERLDPREIIAAATTLEEAREIYKASPSGSEIEALAQAKMTEIGK